MRKYYLLFKTAQAEFRCWRNFGHPDRDRIIPIVEFTRGRKRPRAGADLDDAGLLSTLGVFDFQRNVDDSISAFSSSDNIIVDLTREESLTCAEIAALASSQNAYAAWRQFRLDLSDKGLNRIIPTLIINPTPDETKEDYKKNLISQCEYMFDEHGAVAYRASVLNDSEFVYDLEIIGGSIYRQMELGRRFILILDHEFINTGSGILHALRTSNLVRGIISKFPKIEIVILSTSFPSNVTDLGGEDEGSFPTEETYLYQEIRRQINENDDIYYGDYGSINPIRNDRVIARGGWRPRIDFPTGRNRIYYYREKRDGDSYASHYVSVAKKVKADPLFEHIAGSWGVEQILSAAGGAVPSSSPSFWISARMEIFLHQQLTKLG